MAVFNAHEIDQIRDMISDGLTSQEIAECLAQSECESREAGDFERNAYGIRCSDEDLPDHVIAHNDRLSMGRNDAGEWLGFM